MGVNAELEFDVIKARADGKVLTVVVMMRNTTDKKVKRTFLVKDVFFIDDKGEKKYFVLTDNSGRALVSSLDSNNKSRMSVEVPANGKKLIWMKFPAPSENTRSVDLTLPVALPFDRLAVQR
ncbi:MAG TPA: hypothetical protein ENJ99_04775 [Rhizobiales bacterium]|nr:hypothetical protein [Hyphomicrobiales bacterium]